MAARESLGTVYGVGFKNSWSGEYSIVAVFLFRSDAERFADENCPMDGYCTVVGFSAADMYEEVCSHGRH